MKYDLILLAAGKGSRTGLSYNKVLYPIDENRTVLDCSLHLFSRDSDCKNIIVVCSAEEMDDMKERFGHYEKARFTPGGAARQDSVANGLKEVESDYVFIHDGARPYVRKEDIEHLKQALQKHPAALLMTPSVDTVKLVGKDGLVEKTLERSQVWNAQTPQVFQTDLIKEAHRKAADSHFLGTDDASLVEEMTDAKVACVAGDPSNIKITHPKDLKSAHSS